MRRATFEGIREELYRVAFVDPSNIDPTSSDTGGVQPMENNSSLQSDRQLPGAPSSVPDVYVDTRVMENALQNYISHFSGSSRASLSFNPASFVTSNMVPTPPPSQDPIQEEAMRYLRTAMEESIASAASSGGVADEIRAMAKKRGKKKIAKIRRGTTEAEVAQAITKHTKKKAKAVVLQTSVMDATILNEEKILEAKKKNLAVAKNRASFYKAQNARLNKTEAEIQEEFQQEIVDLKTEEGIQDITIDSVGRMIITTTPLSIEKEGWNEPQVAGAYQIRIDFSQNDISSGVRVLNITKRSGYDSPTISNTKCCWGNIRKDVERDFFTQNVHELVMDMIEYIRSPFVEHGYLGLGGDKTKGWEQWFADATPLVEGYNWEQYDRENPEREIDILEQEGNGRIATLEPDLLGNHPTNRLVDRYLEPSEPSSPRGVPVPTEVDRAVVDERSRLAAVVATAREEIARLQEEVDQLRSVPQMLSPMYAPNYQQYYTQYGTTTIGVGGGGAIGGNAYGGGGGGGVISGPINVNEAPNIEDMITMSNQAIDNSIQVLAQPEGTSLSESNLEAVLA